MSDEPVSTGETAHGTVRLQGAGLGTILGGVAIGFLSVLVVDELAAVLVIGLGVFGWLSARQQNAPTTVSIGVVAIGAIGLVETGTPFGLGLTPIELAGAAVAFGVADIVIGRLLYGRRPDR